MNREMLLEKHKINFEPKLPNLRQMVETQYNHNEDPMIDDILLVANPISTPTQQDNGFEPNETQFGDNWEEVKQIFDNLNSQTTVSTKNCKRDVPTHKDDNTIVMLPNEYESYTLCAKIGNINVKSTENKENDFKDDAQNALHDSTSFNSMQPSSFVLTQNLHSNDVTGKPWESKSLNSLNKITPSVYDVQNRVRQVNVEMFTVKLKAKNSTSNPIGHEN